MDPATSIITLATFLKDLLELGQKIKESIEKVSENRRRSRELTNDVLRSLADISDLLSVRGHGGEVPPPLLGALGDLKADMLHVLEICMKLQPPGNPMRFKVKVKMWLKRDEVEREISRLKDRVLVCYVKFTAFSTARTELHLQNLSLRVEHASMRQVGFRRLEGMVSQMLLDEQSGRDSLNRTITTVLSDPTHTNLRDIEIPYLEAQTNQLIVCLQKAIKGQTLVLDTTAWDPTRPFKSTFVQIISSSSVVHKVLETILTIQRNPSEVMLHSMTDIMLTLGIHLANLGMIPAAIAWELSIIQVLRHVAGEAGIAWILGSLEKLSRFYQYQTQYKLALGASQEFLDCCREESKYGFRSGAQTYPLAAPVSRPLFARILAVHAENLRMTGQLNAATAVAQNAVGFCEEELQVCGMDSEEETEFHAVTSAEAFFALAQSFSAEGRHLDAYTASKKGFKALLRCSGKRPPKKVHIDAFMEQLCALAPEEWTRLIDVLNLFCELTRVYPDEASAVFLRLFYAHIFNGALTLPEILLEHKLVFNPAPAASKFLHIDLFDKVAITALQALYVRPWETRDIRAQLLKRLFQEHLDEAICGLERVISSFFVDARAHSNAVQPLLRWILDDILDFILPAAVTDSSRISMLQIAKNIVQFFRDSDSDSECGWCSFAAVLGAYSRGLWLVGRLTEALSTLDEAIARIQSYVPRAGCLTRDKDGAADEQLRGFLLSRTYLLYDMDRIPQALEATAMPDSSPEGHEKWSYYLIRMRVLRRAGRYHDALDSLAMVESQNEKSEFDIYFPLLLVETAIIHLRLRDPESALSSVEMAVSFCRSHLKLGTNSDSDVIELEPKTCALIHSLTTLSDCLSALRRPGEALAASREATDIYITNASCMWGNFIHTIRREELGANAFRSLSLRSGDSEEGRRSAEKAGELERRLALLAPRCANAQKH